MIDEAANISVDDLNYREVQTKLKELGLPAKGPDKTLRERLSEFLTNGTIPAAEEASSPPPSPVAPPTTRKRKSKQEGQSPKTERYIVTAEIKDGAQAKKQSQQLLSASKAALPDANVRVKRVVKSLSPATPLERVKRFAADSAAKLQDSAHKVQKEMTKQMKKRKWSSWWWLPVLVLLAAIFLGGVSMGRNSAWHKQMSRQMESLQGSLDTLYQASQRQASWVGDNVYQGYGYMQDSLFRGSGRLSQGASYLWDSGSDYAEGTFEKALRYLPSARKFRAALPTSACSARMNATILNGLLPDSKEWDGLKLTLKDAWSGLKDDPLKGTGVLMAGRTKGALQKAAAAIEAAVPSDCKKCYLHIKGEDLSSGGNHAAGELQLQLYHHLERCPNAVIHIENLAEVHADLLTVLLVVLSEQGGLTVNGVSIPSYRALYLGSVVAPESVFAANDEQLFNLAVKRDLVAQFEMRGGLTQSYIAEVFRRRWDYSMPLQ